MAFHQLKKTANCDLNLGAVSKRHGNNRRHSRVRP
jgi:hypothetical protein